MVGPALRVFVSFISFTRDSMFSTFRMGPADADCVISIEYYSDLLNRESKKKSSCKKIQCISVVPGTRTSQFF